MVAQPKGVKATMKGLSNIMVNVCDCKSLYDGSIPSLASIYLTGKITSFWTFLIFFVFTTFFLIMITYIKSISLQ